MNGNSITLFIFEGEKQERKYMNAFLKALSVNIDRVEIAFCTHIYALYKKLERDDGLDTFALLQEKCVELTSINYHTDDVARIYLFFDYDAHVPEANNECIKQMLERFDNETEDGKLFLSYPMLEALVDKSSDFKCAVTSIASGNKYKKHKNIASNDFKEITKKHIKKANYLVCDKYEKPDSPIEQYDIFTAQLTKYVKPNQEVAILSAFPLFVLDYKGVPYIKGL